MALNASSKQANNIEANENGVNTSNANLSKRDSAAESTDEVIVIREYDTKLLPDAKGNYPLKSETIIDRNKRSITISITTEEKKDSSGYQFSFADKSKNTTDIKVKETAHKSNFAYIYYSLLIVLILAIAAFIFFKRKKICVFFRRLLNLF